MVLKLVKNAAGQYEYKDAMETAAPNITANEFEAYTGGTQTTLTGGTDLGTQTASLMRETPGQIETTIDPRTGETRTTGGAQATEIQQQQFAPPSSAELIESPLQKAARIAQQFPMQQQTGPSPQQFLGQIQEIQNKALKADRVNTLLRGGFDLGVSYLRGPTPLNIQQSVTPLTSLTATPVGASTLGGVGLAGAAGYGISKALGGDKKESTAAGVGSAIGMAVGGGPVGAVVGGAIGKVIGCFLPDTLISMSDGSKKKIIDIELKDNVAIGGFVFATGKFLVNDIYDYKGIKVSGSHLVNEKGNWLKVQDSKLSKLVSTEDTVVYTLGTKNRRILINDILFTDYFDIDEQQKMAS
tara:strand:+ start:72 stop:1139 length:1068 start_codon:yes stop_codon:yes gene_type:complete